MVPTPEQKDSLDRDTILTHLQDTFARWWLPDDVIFIDEMPKTAVGKFDKKVLRLRYASEAATAPTSAPTSDGGTQ